MKELKAREEIKIDEVEEFVTPQQSVEATPEHLEEQQGKPGGVERGDFSGRMHGVEQEAGSGSGSSSGGRGPEKTSTYKEWKEQRKRESAGKSMEEPDKLL